MSTHQEIAFIDSHLADWLSNDNLEQYRTELAPLGQSLKPDGDLLFYGCNVG